MPYRISFNPIVLVVFFLITFPALAAPIAKQVIEAKTVYFNDFETDAPGDEWSQPITDVTPKGKRRFLGQFGQETVTLTLGKLPKHKLLSISFDLYIINAWDGNHPKWGPDIFDVGVVGRPLFLHTSFTNCGFFSDNNEQSFPDGYPGKAHPGFSGSAEKQTLGYLHPFGDMKYTCDSVYHFQFTFPHEDDGLKMQWTGRASEPKKDESWGLDNVRVQTLGQIAAVDVAEMSKLWNDLSLDGKEAIRGFQAIWKLVAAGDQSVDFLKSKYITTDYDADEVAKLIAQLDADDFKLRAKANAALEAFGPRIVVPLKNALQGSKSEEVKARLTALLATASKPELLRPAALRKARVAQVLDAINTPVAIELRKALGEAGFPAE